MEEEYPIPTRGQNVGNSQRQKNMLQLGSGKIQPCWKVVGRVKNGNSHGWCWQMYLHRGQVACCDSYPDNHFEQELQ